ncbi:hypothetical protein GJ744_010937 [Endocarpon pusillum]|uniref:F-box domain-containing protein n=1 Tax=Endocarpon pusillum TaxID=364733 RepID=A0A8H7AGR1_9EURO|nr:hypothetical protein GJ744_010937 [Endocarpon pusillum]
MSSLLDLPLELLYSISAAVSPADIVNLACSCKQLLESSKASLARHQKLHSELGFVHDRDALTVPTVLRRVMSQPHTQWHIRKLEAWGSREGWSRWKNYPSNGGGYGYVYVSGDGDANDRFLAWVDRWRSHTYLDSAFFSKAELGRYRQIMLRELRLSEEMTKKWMDLLESGYDEPLKVILIALCEGLRELSYATYDPTGCDAEGDPLSMLSTSIRSIYSLGSPQSCQWPVGFRALHSIIISEPSGYQHRYNSFSSDSATVAPLFLLPAIRELRLNLIGYRESGDYVWE